MRRVAFFLILACVLLLSACAPTRDLDRAPEGEQSIHLWHKGSGERVNVIYRAGGKYIPEAMARIDYIFRDRHTDEVYPISPDLVDVLAGLRDRMALPPDTEIEVLSGYRSPETNANLAKTNRYVAKQSFHMKGQAVDIRIPGMISPVLEHVARSQQRGGVALYPDSGHVHVDVGPVRGWSVLRGQEEGTRRAAAAPTHYHGRASVPRDTTYAVPLRAPKGQLQRIEDSYSDLPSVSSLKKAGSKTGKASKAGAASAKTAKTKAGAEAPKKAPAKAGAKTGAKAPTARTSGHAPTHKPAAAGKEPAKKKKK